MIQSTPLKNIGKPRVVRIDNNVSNPEIFEEAGRKVFGNYGCFPMIALGKLQNLSAFKMLSRAKNIEPEIANDVSKQIQSYELDRKHKIENNADDPDYNIDEHIDINDYVEEKYHQLIEDSKKYQGINMSIACHPCARLCYHKDLRYEIGLISLKPKAGEKERRLAVFIEGATADAAGYCKNDILKVDVVSVINDTFRAINEETPSVDGLKSWVNEHPEVWSLYARGFTLGLNQTEKYASTQKVMALKPKNVVELSAFVAAIRPGAKSLVNDFCSRTFHNYGIPAMDDMLKLNGATGVTGESSYIFFDEQILHLAEAAGIEPGDAVTLIKSIKKKKKEKVLAYQEKFIPGFTNYLITKENDNEQHAKETSEAVWKVIQDSAAYLFNASHALAMAYDSLYGAMLKTIAPFEFYKTLLKLYTSKGQKDKISIAIKEMKAYKGIRLTTGKFGQDNRDWYIDKENNTISQDIASIKFMSPKVAEDLYNLSFNSYNTFTDLLRDIQMNTCLNTRQISILISIGYFNKFGKTKKLKEIFDEFFCGKNKLTKTIKSFDKRICAVKEFECSASDEDASIKERLDEEMFYTGMCFSTDKRNQGVYYVTEVDDKYGVKLMLYNLIYGTYSPYLKMTKTAFASNPIRQGMLVKIDKTCFKNLPKKKYVNGQMIKSSNETEMWLYSFEDVSNKI